MIDQIDPQTWKLVTEGDRRGRGAAARYQLLQQLREISSEEVDQRFLGTIDALREGLEGARENIEALTEIHRKITAPPFHPAAFMRHVPEQDKAEVFCGTEMRIVTLGEEVDAEALRLGDEVFLNHERNLLLCKSPWEVSRVGETATVERIDERGQLVVKSRDEILIVMPAATLNLDDLTIGDRVLWDRKTFVAYEKTDRSETEEFLHCEIPDATRDMVGGQQANLDELLATLTVFLADPDKAQRYGIHGRRSILLVGPPGCGKTMMARVAAAEVSRISGRKCRFFVIPPSAWESPFVGETQQRIRSCFRTLRAAAEEDGFVVLFLDEVESIARIRGSMSGHHSDKFLSSFLAEIDGFADRGNVAIVSATNRKDLLAPEAYDRLAEVELQVERPKLSQAREIFKIHMADTVPFSPNGQAASSTRHEILDRAVSQLFDPNGDNKICRIMFRDGKQRVVAVREVISGRLIEQACRAARQRAMLRDVSGCEPGVCTSDMEEALCDVIRRLSTTLTVHNVRSFLADLPQDLDVVSVQPVVRKSRRKTRYLNPS